MLLPAETLVGEGVFVTATSASAATATIVVLVAELLLETGSVAVVVTLAVSTICVPRAVPELICVVNVMVTGVPTATVPTLQVTVPAELLHVAPVAET